MSALAPYPEALCRLRYKFIRAQLHLHANREEKISLKDTNWDLFAEHTPLKKQGAAPPKLLSKEAIQRKIQLNTEGGGAVMH